ncbi:IS110 family transposase [Mycobacterium scrofulaceum]|uniref:IS110 family transposase n=2 Tax=Mycobacterium scrofulaceum TaxID=1783 RepID=A0A1X0JJL6_MYCSC|nr:IS110 family transposase [Mycobacterium scrofulaceum]
MVVVGADVHKRTHTFVAVDQVGRKIGEKVVEATTVGHRQAIRWARTQFGVELAWAIEDCRHLSARLERDLLSADQKVVRVPSKLMAQTRASARTRGKSDPIDALAVARAYLREPDLPVASHDEVSRELKLLVDRREDLVGQRTSTINRLLWRVHELDPGQAPKPASLDLAKHRRMLGDWLAAQPGLVAELAREELADITRLTEAINVLAKRIGERVRAIAPVLLAMPGCGELTAAKIIGETAGVARFKSEAAFARHSGVAPIPVWSGNTVGRVRMTRTGNRQLNAALHRIAVTQIRLDSLGQAYYRSRLAAGDSSTEALRCLKRRLARVVFHHLHTDHNIRTKPCQPAAA